MVSLKYRPEIDGLRALAVLSVIFYHGGMSLFSGGFVGVDIFFVISGYLITSIILKGFYTNRFSFKEFYKRRVFRILPALFFITLVTLPFSWLWLLPQEFDSYIKSIGSLVLMGSNIFFWMETGYFAPQAELKPLLHTWSLGVEEQFYLFFPIVFIFLLRKLRLKYVCLFLFLFAVLSLFLSHAFLFKSQSFSYYMLPTRAWELLIGGIGAVIHAKKFKGIKGDQFLSLIGFVMVLCSIFLLDATVPFPGLAALPVVLGSILVLLFTGPNTIVYRLLSNKVSVSIGLISYSLYLWHQPVFAFARIRWTEELDIEQFLVLFILIGTLSYLTWKFVESPFRTVSRIKYRGWVLGISFCVLMGVFSAGLFMQGAPWRFSEKVPLHLSYIDDNNPRINQCRDQNPLNACIYGADSLKPRVALWGDSHSDQLAPMLSKVGEELGFSMVQWSFAGCMPTRYMERVGRPDLQCSRKSQQVIDILEQNTDIDVVIMHAYWQLYLDEKHAEAENNISIADNVLDTVEYLLSKGKKVIIIGPVPRMPFDPPIYYARAEAYSGSDNKLSISLDDFEQQTATSNEIFRSEKLLKKDFIYFDITQILCSNGHTCSSKDGDVILYRDNNHLSVSGTMYLKDNIAQTLSSVLTHSKIQN